jgi:hypothetical protein
VGPEVDDLVAQHGDVALGDGQRLADQLLRALRAVTLGLVRRGGEGHVQPDHLLYRPIVKGVGHPPADVGLRPHRPARELASPQPRGGLGIAEAAHQCGGQQRREGEHGLVEREQLVMDGGAGGQGAGDHERRHRHRGEGEAQAPSLEMGVHRDE